MFAHNSLMADFGLIFEFFYPSNTTYNTIMKLAKGRGDVLSLHLQTGHQVVFLSAFHALLRHVHSIYSPQTSLLFAPNLGEEMRKDNVLLYEM